MSITFYAGTPPRPGIAIGKPEKPNAGYVYIIKCGDRFKIGCTGIGWNRIKQYGRTTSPYDAIIYGYYCVCDYKKHESTIHWLFKDKREKGEWFKLNDNDLTQIDAYLNEREVL